MHYILHAEPVSGLQQKKKKTCFLLLQNIHFSKKGQQTNKHMYNKISCRDKCYEKKKQIKGIESDGWKGRKITCDRVFREGL